MIDTASAGKVRQGTAPIAVRFVGMAVALGLPADLRVFGEMRATAAIRLLETQRLPKARKVGR